MSEMQIKIVAFGVARDIIGGREMTLSMKSGINVSEAMEELRRQFPAFDQLAAIRLAIDEEYVEADHPIVDGNELVIIPPVSGG